MVKNTRLAVNAVNTAVAIAKHLIHRESSMRTTIKDNRLLPKSDNGSASEIRSTPR